MTDKNLSVKAKRILRQISTGHSYEQIIKINPEYTYIDIFKAAEEALGLLTDNGLTPHEERIARIKEKYPRAYESWSKDEEQKLIELHLASKTTEEISAELQRQPGAIRSRLDKLGFGSNADDN